MKFDAPPSVPSGLFSTLLALTLLTLPLQAQVAEPTPDEVPAEDGAFVQLLDVARQLAAEPYTNNDTPLPESLLQLDYDAHRDIRCLPENFLWYGSTDPFRVQFRHRGWLFKDEVDVSTVSARGGDVTPLPFSPNRFTYGPLAEAVLNPDELPRDLGYAGVALHRVAFETTDGKTTEAYNEIMSLQGGCYFRAIGDGQHWGASARAVAINTALPRGEEFPRWEQLWIKQPLPGDESLTLYGLLDGPTVAGAYRMVVTPGPTLTVDIDGRLFFREAAEKVGLAPITSMFLFGEDEPAKFNDYRPEVHDSDTLVLANADGSVDIRPLRNPTQGVSVSRFSMTNPKGFGLMQRDRDFGNYEDLETEMQIRPSIWITPKGDWGQGWVELLEIASDDEGVDNVGAYWIASGDSEGELLGGPGVEKAISYRVDFTREPRPVASELLRWVATRTISSDESADVGSVVRTLQAEALPDGSEAKVLRVLLDCEADSALSNGTIVRADVQATRGQILGQPVVQYNRFTNAYRLFFDVAATGPEPLELRAVLRGADKQPLSETWLYRWDLP